MKTLVDLAMMSAQGQGDVEVQKVQSLHAAVMGYAPLIFDLCVDADLPALLKQCKSVWRSLAADFNLPKHLVRHVYVTLLQYITLSL